MFIVESIIDNANEKLDITNKRIKNKLNDGGKKQIVVKSLRLPRWEISMMGKCETLLFYFFRIYTRKRWSTRKHDLCNKVFMRINSSRFRFQCCMHFITFYDSLFGMNSCAYLHEWMRLNQATFHDERYFYDCTHKHQAICGAPHFINPFFIVRCGREMKKKKI